MNRIFKSRLFHVLVFAILIYGSARSQINPGHVGSITNQAGAPPFLSQTRSVFISGNYAYVASEGNDALEIVDITNPSVPVHVGSLINGTGGALLDDPYSVHVAGNYAYVASWYSDALEIVDISNPTTPVHAGSLTHGTGGALLDDPYSVYVAGNYAYVVSEGSNALEIVDISNPTAPVHAGSLTDGTGGALLGRPYSVHVAGNYAYVASFGSDALEIVDISNPTAPVHAGSLTDGTGGALLANPNSVHVSGNYAYVASEGSNALEIVDISNPNAPVHAGSLTDGTGGALLGRPYSVHVSGNYAYVASEGSDALEIVDISNPTAPVHAGSLTDGTGGALLANPNSVHVTGNYAYVTSEFSDALEIVNISNPTAPVHAGSLINGTGGALLDRPYSVYVAGNYAYVASFGSNALEIVDISIPTAPVHAGGLTHGTGGALLNRPWFVHVADNHAYVAGLSNSALEIVNVSNPTSPVHAGSLTHGTGGALLDGPRSVHVDGNYAYVTSIISDGLEIVDIFNPTAPAHAGSLTPGAGGALLDEPHSVHVAGNYAYVASRGNDALEIVDISIPTAPVHAGSLTHGTGGALLDGPYTVYVSGNYAYVASFNSNALEIVDISTPTAPVHAGSLTHGTGGALLGNPNSVYVSGNYAYLTSWSSPALEIVDISNPTAPVHAASLTNGTGGALLRFPWSVQVAGNYAYVASEFSDALEIVYLYYPDITDFTPGSGAAGTSVTINGKNFNTSAVVNFDGKAAAVTNVTLNSLTATVPNNATLGKVSVSVNGFEYTSTDDFYVSPTASVATGIQQTQFSANWSDVGGSGHFLDVSTDNFASFVSGFNDLSVGNVTSYPVSGLNAATTYQFRVRSSNASGTSVNSNVVSALTIPATPTTTAATAISQTGFMANWDAVTGATEYYLDVATDAGFTSVESGYDNLQVTGTSATVTGLLPGTTYYYRIRSANASGNSPSSMVASQVTRPADPVATNATSIGQTSLAANWDPVTGVDNYYLEVSTNSDLSDPIAGYDGTVALPSTSSSEIVTNVTPGTTYYYRVSAENAGGKSGVSNIISVLTIPATPTAAAATAVSQTGFTANWDAVTSATEYYLDVATDAGFTSLVDGYDNLPVAGTSVAITGLLSGIVYYYRIRSTNVSGSSPSSDAVSQITVPADPIATDATSIGQTSITANWDPVTGSDNYYLEVSSNPDLSDPIAGYDGTVGLPATSSSEIIANLLTGTIYYYQVAAENTAGRSDVSNIISQITVPANPVANEVSEEDITTTSFVAQWNAVGGASEYEVEVSSNDFVTSLAGYNPFVLSGTSLEITGLSPETAYTFRVRAKNEGGAFPAIPTRFQQPPWPKQSHLHWQLPRSLSVPDKITPPPKR